MLSCTHLKTYCVATQRLAGYAKSANPPYIGYVNYLDPLGNCSMRCPTDGVHAVVTPTLSLRERGFNE